MHSRIFFTSLNAGISARRKCRGSSLTSLEHEFPGSRINGYRGIGVPEVIPNTALSEVKKVHSRMFYRRLMPALRQRNAAGLLLHPDNCKTPPPADAGNGVLAFPR